jgi:hypothetical protein
MNTNYNLQQKQQGTSSIATLYTLKKKYTPFGYLSTGMDSSLLDSPQTRVLVWIGTLGSLPISSRIEITIAALLDGESFSLERMFLILSADRLIFLGTESSLVILSSASMHCFMTSLEFSGTVITTGCFYKTKRAYKGY